MFKRILKYIKTRLYVNETIILFFLEQFQNQISKVEIKYATYDNLKDILNFQDKRYIKIFENFLNIGDKGYFAYLNDKCVHRSWVKFNEQIVYPHFASSYKLKKDEIFIHYCETSLEARGQNIYPHVLSVICNEHKLNKILIAINEKNIPSLKGAKKVGFCELYKIHVLIILGIKFVKYENKK
ncbi:hypothetical protein CBLAS_0716 [Campylobacter blaseri]|uniref:N-acetyltransferase domain-containing protein n=1 Tax=Campylobacter blaseri TaxID=2042961 RepID=A0A2P8R291_9BACT|nr:hypothetical protein [Campylobacter blaseri]PSM52607.1 hypothetical protein CQ405_02435 [Campylobacter blaseri]PSM54255.1 hypothetical protein CRN67_02435 [Campylobacter blaseri]QKF85906.1 hypothetical protein CBLAS_0716 [Campylobacter blaseri]